MGLKDLTSQLDLVGGNEPVGNMEGQSGPQFQLPTTNASQKHIDSLTEQSSYQHGNSGETLEPSNLDLNGVQGPNFDNGMSSNLHPNGLIELYQYTYGNSTETTGPSTLDLNGADNGNGTFDNGTDSNLQQDSLANAYESIVNPGASYGAGQPGGVWPTVNSANLDLDGAPGPQFEGSTPQTQQQTLHTDLLANIYESSVNPLASFGAGQPGGSWPSIQPSPLASTPFADLDGITPGQYINNQPD